MKYEGHLGPSLVSIAYHLCSCLLPSLMLIYAYQALQSFPIQHALISLHFYVFAYTCHLTWNTFPFCFWEILCSTLHSEITSFVDSSCSHQADAASSALPQHLVYAPFAHIPFHCDYWSPRLSLSLD